MLNSEERGNYQLIKSVGCLTEFLHTDDFLGVTFLLLVAQKATQQVCQTAFFLERSALCKHARMHTRLLYEWNEVQRYYPPMSQSELQGDAT